MPAVVENFDRFGRIEVFLNVDEYRALGSSLSVDLEDGGGGRSKLGEDLEFLRDPRVQVLDVSVGELPLLLINSSHVFLVKKPYK